MVSCIIHERNVEICQTVSAKGQKKTGGKCRPRVFLMCFLERESLAPVHFFGNICLGGAFLKGESTASDFFIVKSGLGADLLVLCVVFEEARVDEALDCGGCGVSGNIDLDIFCQRTCRPKCLDAWLPEFASSSPVFSPVVPSVLSPLPVWLSV